MTIKIAILRESTATPGHWYGVDARGERLDTFGGPLDFVARYYAASGYRIAR